MAGGLPAPMIWQRLAHGLMLVLYTWLANVPEDLQEMGYGLGWSLLPMLGRAGVTK